MTEKPYLLGVADAMRLPFPDRSVDLVFGSPPYLDARTYGIGAQRDCAAWIDWMLDVTTEACRVSRGLVLWVVAGVVRQYFYQPAPEGLLYEWWKRGGMAWRPAYWYRSGIPGSGGQHWLRADVEYVLAFVGPDRRPRRGRPATHYVNQKNKLGNHRNKDGSIRILVKSRKPVPDNAGEPDPDDLNAFWTDNTAMGHKPKEHHGKPVFSSFDVNGAKEYVSHPAPILANPGNLIETPEDEGFWTDNTAMGHPHKPHNNNGMITDRKRDGSVVHKECTLPALANPGNLIKTNRGYGSMGSSHAHDNEAPFPEALAEFFIRTACPPDGIVLDPFSGSGTTVAVAERTERRGLGFDIRRSQAELAVRRITRPHLQRQRNGHTEKDLPLFSK